MDELLDTAPCGYLSFGDDGVVGTVNATLVDMLGYSRDQVLGSHVEKLLTTSSRIFYQTHFFPLLRLEGRAEEIFLTFRKATGDPLAVLANAVRRERGGTMVIECVLVHLIQRQKWEDEIIRAKREAEEANRAKSAFLSMMSHDLRTPLNAISGYADLIRMGIRGPVTEAQTQDLDRIKEASRFLQSLLADVLNFARLEAGQLDMRTELIVVDAALRQAEVLVEPQLSAAKLTYSRTSCAADTVVKGDGERLQQILLNLLTNAVKFTPEGGAVIVSCEAAADRVVIRVADTGPGIPQDKLEQIFQPFVQVSGGPESGRKPGVGLGLAISRELARAMGGDLTVESTLGAGSIFILALPRASS